MASQNKNIAEYLDMHFILRTGDHRLGITSSQPYYRLLGYISCGDLISCNSLILSDSQIPAPQQCQHIMKIIHQEKRHEVLHHTQTQKAQQSQLEIPRDQLLTSTCE